MDEESIDPRFMDTDAAIQEYHVVCSGLQAIMAQQTPPSNAKRKDHRKVRKEISLKLPKIELNYDKTLLLKQDIQQSSLH